MSQESEFRWSVVEVPVAATFQVPMKTALTKFLLHYVRLMV